RVEHAVDDVLERIALLREDLPAAGTVEGAGVRLEDDVGDLAVPPDREHLLTRELEALVPVLRQVDPDDVPPGQLLEAVDLRDADVIFGELRRDVEVREGAEIRTF